MKETKLAYPFAELHGAVEHKGAINRKKIYRDADGKIIYEGKQELYKVVHPRDFKRNPQTPGELHHHECFRAASKKAIAIIHAMDESSNPSPELLEELSVWQTRFHAQLLSNKGSKPDPEAPVDPKTGKAKRYARLDTFIRAIVYHQLRAQDNL